MSNNVLYVKKKKQQENDVKEEENWKYIENIYLYAYML